MVSNRITEGVGKKIVEALKQQSDIEIQNVVENPVPVAEEHPAPTENEIIYNEEEPIYETTNEEVVVNQENTEEEPVKEEMSEAIKEEKSEVLNEPVEQETPVEKPFNSINLTSFENPAPDFSSKFTSPHVMNFTQAAPISQMIEKENFANELDGFDIPANIAVLKQLINQLPAGVSRQTGAQIIKQTMEALGISMKSVLQEAQQVQESLNNSARECQASIMEYKKQINVLEKQSQKFQKQYAALNEIISLFVQTGI